MSAAAREATSHPPCLICRSHVSAPFHAAGRDRLFGVAPGTFDLYRCSSCACIFQHPVPDSGRLSAFYPDEYWWSEGCGREGGLRRLRHRLERRYREWVTRGHLRFLERSARAAPARGRRLLDIGCGSGTFLQLAQRRGFIVHGMDMSAKAAGIAREQYGIEVRHAEIGSDVWGDSRFDFITMFHVLEHLPEPGKGLEYAGHLLAPEGRLIIQVPNVDSWQAQLFGRRWYGLDVPRHLINFSGEALRRLLVDTGYEALIRTTFSLRDNPASWASSFAPALDPIGRRVRRRGSSALASLSLESVYLGLFLICTPMAWAECAFGNGGTLWAEAVRRRTFD